MNKDYIDKKMYVCSLPIGIWFKWAHLPPMMVLEKPERYSVIIRHNNGLIDNIPNALVTVIEAPPDA